MTVPLRQGLGRDLVNPLHKAQEKHPRPQGGEET